MWYSQLCLRVTHWKNKTNPNGGKLVASAQQQLDLTQYDFHAVDERPLVPREPTCDDGRRRSPPILSCSHFVWQKYLLDLELREEVKPTNSSWRVNRSLVFAICCGDRFEGVMVGDAEKRI